MFDNNLPKVKVVDFPRDLERLSVSDLEDYVQELHGEIKRVEGDIKQKKTSQEAAASIFK